MSAAHWSAPRRARASTGVVALGLAALVLTACSDDRPPARTTASGPQASAAAPTSALQTTVAAQRGDFDDIASERGLDYVNRSGEPAKATILEANGAGVALLDLQSDGDLDVVFTQGLSSLAALVKGPGADVEVFENDGRGFFTRRPGPGLNGWWTGLAAGDVDNDGDADLVVAGFGDLVLLRQSAQGELEIASESGLSPAARWVVGEERQAGHPPAWATSIALFDADRDGRLDLYVGQYLDLDPRAPPIGKLGEGALAVACRWKGQDVFCGPRGLSPQADRVLRGGGDGTFRDVTSEWLPGHVAGFTLAVLPLDADGDGDTDLFVANDSAPNLFLVNDGGLDGACRFRDFADPAGVALSADGRAQAGMGLSAGDVDRDGRMDLVVTNFSDEATELYLGAERGFDRATFRYGLARETRALLSWGVHLFDADGDGWLELFTANGHVYPQADRPHTGTRYGQPATLWHLGPEANARAFTPASDRSIFAPAIGTRGSAVGDLDGDGAPDLVLARIDAPASLGANTLGASRRRLAIRCLGARAAPSTGAQRTPADGMGARAIVIAGAGSGEEAWLAEVQTAAGYQSASTPWLHLGLGQHEKYSEIEIRWPSGRVEKLPGGASDRRLIVREGEGVIASEAFR